jgi:RND superfamily putative drug exporter
VRSTQRRAATFRHPLSGEGIMNRALHRLGRITAGHPWRTVLAWVAVAAAVLSAASVFGGTPQDNHNIDDARAQTGIEILRERFPGSGAAGSTAQVVVHDPAGTALDPADVSALTDRLTALDHVSSVTPPRLSADRDTALLTVVYDVPITHPDLAGGAAMGPLEEATAEAGGLQIELGGQIPGALAGPLGGTGELVGILVALILMVLVLGTVVAAGLPIVVALAGLGVSAGGVTLLAAAMDVSTTAPTVAIMVGLGVGIDYALLLVIRHLEFLRTGLPVAEAAGRAVATAGRSVLFASATVLVALMGLPLAGLPVYSSFGFATAIAVVAVAAAALTLVPALCGLLGRRLLGRRERRGLPARRTRPDRAPLTARWAAAVGRRPLPWALVGLVAMLALAAPAVTMRTWPQDISNNPADSTTRQAYDIVAAEYGPGANGPLTVLVDREAVGDEGVAETAQRLARTEGVAAVGDPVVSPDGAVAVLEVQPAYAPADERTPELLERLRADLPDVEVTGHTALLSDISTLLSERIWLVVGFVVLVSMILLAAMFRSLLIPIKAAVLNVLSVAAAYGVVTAVYQWGWGLDLVGLDHAMPVSSWLPILMFAVLFGLSMDYEVFLLSRIREYWLRSGDAHDSVIRGLAGTGRVISTAAAVMIAVFLGFATESEIVIQQLGLGMAVAILLDATVVRLMVVPAVMAILGRRSWWLPGWLDRLLPGIEAETAENDAAAAATGPRPTPDRDRTPVEVPTRVP